MTKKTNTGKKIINKKSPWRTQGGGMSPLSGPNKRVRDFAAPPSPPERLTKQEARFIIGQD